MFGEPEKNTAVNAVVAITAAFMVWAYPFLSGVTPEEYESLLSAFFFQSLTATLVIMFGLIVFSMFLPKGIGEFLSEKFNENKFTAKFWLPLLIVVLLISVGVFFSSGISRLFFPSTPGISISEDMIYSIITVIVLLGIIAYIVFSPGGGSESKAQS